MSPNRLLVLGALLALAQGRAWADPVALKATVRDVFGNATLWHDGVADDTAQPDAMADEDTPGQAIQTGAALVSGDHIETGDNSGVVIALEDGSVITLGEQTDFTLNEASRDGSQRTTLFTMLKGLFRASVAKLAPGSRFELTTASGVAAVKGTQYEAEAGDQGTTVRVDDGKVWMAHQAGEQPVEVAKGQAFDAAMRGSWGRPRALRAEEMDHIRQYWARDQFRRRARMAGRMRGPLRRRAMFAQIYRTNREHGLRYGHRDFLMRKFNRNAMRQRYGRGNWNNRKDQRQERRRRWERRRDE